MKEYNLEPKYESCLDEIDKIKKKNKNLEWDDIKSLIYIYKDSWEYLGFPEDYEEKWDELVDYRKNIEERSEKSTGYLYDTSNIRQEIKVPTNSNSAWMVFKNMLMEKFPGVETIINSEKSAQRILESLKRESQNEESGKGLVMGYVQSGKTTNIESVITMGADYGYNIFVMLSGTIENLRKQNLSRLQSDIEFSPNSNIQWKFFDNIKGEKLDGYLQNDKARIVTVCLKNSTRLKNLNKWLIDSTSLATKAKMNVVIIDDEADQASLNTKKMEKDEIERTKINKLILELVNCKKFHSTNYISYTATPYGNFLNENSEESLYPKDFIISLPKSSQYIGASEIFGNEDDITEPLPIIEEINEDDYRRMENINSTILDFPDSLKDAICWFICTLAVQRFRKSIKPASMLIHTNNKQKIHKDTADAVEKWLNKNKKYLLEDCKSVYEKEKNAMSKEQFLGVMKNYNFDGLHPIQDYPTFEQIENEVKDILNAEISHITITEKGDLKFHNGIHIVIDNSNNKKGIDENGNFIRLAYPEKGTVKIASGLIVIGGNTLARGLTLDGLTSSYFSRRVPQADSLMQMGRWFGYRIGYELLPRIWLTKEAEAKFKEVSYIENRLREDLKKYDLGTKPSEYAPKIQNSYLTRFLLTSKNKSQNASRAGATYEKVDNQTVVFESNSKVQSENKNNAIKFIKGLFLKNDYNVVKDSIVFNKVNYKEIEEYLFKKMKFYNQDRFFGNINDFCKWMENQKNDENLNNWDIIIENDDLRNSENSIMITEDISIKKVNRSQRKKHLENTIDIGVLRNPKDRINACLYEKGYEGELEEVERPKLFMYFIDKDSKVERASKDKEGNPTRVPLDFETDIVGLYLYIPNTNKNNKDRIIWTQKMKEVSNEI